MSQFNRLGGVLETVLTGLEMGSRTREYLALILWADIVGEHIARITVVQSVRDGVLHVDVESSAWAQELHFYKPELLSKVNKYVGSEAIRDIHFRTRTILKPRSGREKGSARRTTRNNPPDIQLTLEECQQIEEIGSQVRDPEIRAALISTMASYRRLERSLVLDGWKRCKKCKAVYQRPRGCPFCAF